MQLNVVYHRRDHEKTYYYRKLVLYMQDINYSLWYNPSSDLLCFNYADVRDVWLIV